MNQVGANRFNCQCKSEGFVWHACLMHCAVSRKIIRMLVLCIVQFQAKSSAHGCFSVLLFVLTCPVFIPTGAAKIILAKS